MRKICEQCLAAFIDRTPNHLRIYCDKHSTRSAKHLRNRRRIKELIFKILGGKKCRRCGFSDIRALQLDHVKGNGAAERRKFGVNWEGFYRFVLKHPEWYQILCANCNWIKRFENGEDGK